MGIVKVEYVGMSGTRILPREDLRMHGVFVDRDMVWALENGYTAYLDTLTPAMEKLLRAEGTFTITEISEETGKELEIVKGQVLDDTGGVVKDSTTGQVSKQK